MFHDTDERNKGLWRRKQEPKYEWAKTSSSIRAVFAATMGIAGEED